MELTCDLSREYLLHHRVCPLERGGSGKLRVAVSHHTRSGALDEVGIAYGCAVETELFDDEEIDVLVERLYSRLERTDRLAIESEESSEVTSDIRDLANQPPVIRWVNLLIRDAFEAGASDVHLEATRSGLMVRFRIDGVLTGEAEPAKELQAAVVSRIKLLAELDIAERRRPQDGRIRVRLGIRDLDVRVSTVPTIFGESVVLRLLTRGGEAVRLEDLGMPPDILRLVGELIRRPHGMLLTTGPTGSGKTTTLYAALGIRSNGAEKVMTVEDPVEYQLDGVTQVPVHRQAGVTFASALRSILRQDPDVIMVGEMRDSETAEIAIQAALTGHKVLSTLHTNDTLGALPRLKDLGVADYLAAATLDGVIAQRLVRRVCPDCRVEHSPSAEVLGVFGAEKGPSPTRYTRGAGCPACRGTGFSGRIGLYELLLFTPEMRSALMAGESAAVVSIAGRTQGRTLLADGWEKVRRGLTTPEEVLRVLHGVST